eukprot:9395260-Ditylum_brightwellii.AAC.1
MAEDNRAMKSLMLPTFNGEQKSFQIRWMRFSAYGTVYGSAQSIQVTADPNLPMTKDATLGSDNVRVKQRKALNMKAIAMYNFTMEFTTEANVIAVSLHKKYLPKDLVSKIKLQCNLNTIIMKKDEDPDHLFEKLLGLEN